ncbi:MAG: nitronate monooxygenase [Dehalococcoidia bacterium]
MASRFPDIIQGGMGVAVSNWRLARAVSRSGALGVVSGTGIGIVLARRLQLGDPDGAMRRALQAFPAPAIAQRVLDKYFIPGGKPAGKRFRPVPLANARPPASLIELIVCGNFCEVWLAKEGHDGVVGVNYLEKVQRLHLASAYGAMLAGVDVVLMGAGIPVQIPGVLDRLAQHEPVRYTLDVAGALPGESFSIGFDPRALRDWAPETPLHRPAFFTIIASALLAKVMTTRASGSVEGFVVEGPTAGGHNAPPRGKLQLDDRGQPIYGERDVVDLAKLREIGLPFWLAGSFGSAEKLVEAKMLGARGIQVGSAFALCEESGLADKAKAQLRSRAWRGELDVRTDPLASPSGFPFKVVQSEGSLSDHAVVAARPRLCDVGRLQEAYRTPDGTIGYRCPAEPVEDYLAKGGRIEETVGRVCLCNALLSGAGYAQRQPNGYWEDSIYTLGDEHRFLRDMLPDGERPYSASEVVAYLRGERAPIEPALAVASRQA